MESKILAAYVSEAKENDPNGIVCGFCGKENDNADDCGWWYLDPFHTKESKPACNHCSNEKGYLRIHQNYYGVGDR